jgi:protein pelota
MRIIHVNEREGRVKLEPETVEDLWHLSKIINSGDVIISHTERRYRIPGAKAEAGEKKSVMMELSAEKIELHKHANVLRVTGKILGGTPEEYIQKGSYHTIDISLQNSFVLKKIEWTTYDRERLKDAQKSSRRPMLKIVVMDERHANFATLRGYGIEYECEVESKTSKRDEQREERMKKYFGEIMKLIEDSKKTLVAGPGFSAESLKDYIKDKNPKLLKTISFGHSSTAERSGIYELLRSGEVSRILEGERISLEFEKIENFQIELRKESGLAVYGPKEIRAALESGALKELYVLDEVVRKDPTFLEDARARRVEVTIFTSEEEPWKRLKSFGGIAGIARYRLN